MTRKELSYSIKVITPFFGGGVEPGENDVVTPIRGSAIRGHLRFWWRATRGARFGKVAELADAEGKIWGTTSKPSEIEIEVNTTRQGTIGEYEALAKESPLGYVLFPFKGNARDKIPSKKYLHNTRFTLTFRFPEALCADVEAAMWGWVNFGGIGARTRRGCGALFCKELAPSSENQLGVWLNANKTAFELTEYPIRPWPTLWGIRVKPQAEPPDRAWNHAINVLHRFRQGDIGRNAGQGGRSGRSRWPEADSLRALTGQSDPRHSQSITLKNPKTSPAFPRASLGLPIVFHFKDKQDPVQVEVYPAWKDSTRMASPLVLRPLGIGDGSKALPMVVRLRTPTPPALRFNDDSLGQFPGKQVISRPDLSTYPNSPMTRRSSKGSALAAFLALAKEEGFKEIS